MDFLEDALGLGDLRRVSVLKASVEAASKTKNERNDDSDEHIRQGERF